MNIQNHIGTFSGVTTNGFTQLQRRQVQVSIECFWKGWSSLTCNARVLSYKCKLAMSSMSFWRKLRLRSKSTYRLFISTARGLATRAEHSKLYFCNCWFRWYSRTKWYPVGSFPWVPPTKTTQFFLPYHLLMCTPPAETIKFRSLFPVSVMSLKIFPKAFHNRIALNSIGIRWRWWLVSGGLGIFVNSFPAVYWFVITKRNWEANLEFSPN